MEMDNKRNKKTLLDQHGQYPIWMNSRQRKKLKAQRVKGKKKSKLAKGLVWWNQFCKIMNILFNKINFSHKLMRFCTWSLSIINCVEQIFEETVWAANDGRSSSLVSAKLKKQAECLWIHSLSCGYLFSWGVRVFICEHWKQ